MNSISTNPGETILNPEPQVKGESKLEIPIEGFSIMRVLNICLVTENIRPILSITNCWLEYKFLSFKSYIYSDQKLNQEAKIKLAMCCHKAYKVGICYSKAILGEENVLVTTRNIANKEVLRNREDAQCYIDLRNMLSEKIQKNDLASVLGYNKEFLPDSVQQDLLKTDFKPISTNTDGVCSSAVKSLAVKILNEPEISESILIKHVEAFHKGVPAEVAAKQDIGNDFWIDSSHVNYDKLTPSIKTNICNRVLDIICDRAERQGKNIFENKKLMNEIQKVIEKVILTLQIYTLNLEPDQRFNLPQELIIYALYPDSLKDKELKDNLKYFNKKAFENIDQEVKSFLENLFKDFDYDLLVEEPTYNSRSHMFGLRVDFEGTARARLVLGDYQNKKNSREHLQNFDDLEPGVYYTYFTTVTGHCVLYVKNNLGEGYIFDPNIGLIKCKKDQHALTYLKLLAMYPPPSDKKEYEDDNRNYRVGCLRFAKRRF